MRSVLCAVLQMKLQYYRVLFAVTYCNCGMIPDLSVTGVMGVMGVIGVMGQKGEAPVPFPDMDKPSWGSDAAGAVESWEL